MKNEKYSRVEMIITQFDKDDVITTSLLPPSGDPYEGEFGS